MDKVFYNIRKNIFWIILVGLYIIQVDIGLVIDYPPTKEYLRIATGNIFCLRIIVSFFLLMSWVLIYKIVKKESDLIGKFFLLIIITLPILGGLWLSRPIESFKVIIVNSILYLSYKFKKNYFFIGLIIFVAGFSYLQNFDKSNIFHIFNSRNLANQVIEKFSKEDTLEYRIDLPLWFRRIAYNKISFAIKGTLKELISFWNIEDFFYQEFHPASKKGLPIFFWPLIIPFIIGLYPTFKQKSDLNVFLFNFFVLSYVNYLISTSDENYRLILAVPLGTIIISRGLAVLKKFNVIYLLVIFLWFYGWQLFGRDFLIRNDYWLDNRPLVYKFIFGNLSKVKEKNKIIVSDLAGNAEKYCIYYLKYACDGRFVFKSFNLSNNNSQGNIYAGFVGEYLGPDNFNKFPNDSEYLILSKGFKKIASKTIRDAVVYKYGELIFIGLKE